MGKISLQGIEIFGRIGVTADERRIGRKFVVDIEIQTSLQKASQKDDIQEVLNYELLAHAVHKMLKKEYRLLEAAARAIGEEIITKAPQLEKMKIRISKHSPLIKGNIERSVVEWDYPEDY